MIIIVALQLLGVIEFKSNYCKVPNKKVGLLGGVLSSPCSTPILIAILAFVAGEGNIIIGVLMLLLYSIGHCTLILIAGTSIGFVESISNSKKTLFVSKILKTILAMIVMLLGLYLIYIGI